MGVGQMFGWISGEADVRGGTVTVRAQRTGNDGPDFVVCEVSGPSLSGLVAVYPLAGGLPDVGEVERVIVVASGCATGGPFAMQREDRLMVQGAPVEVVMVFRADGTEVDTSRLAVISPRFPDQRVLAFLDPVHAYAREAMRRLSAAAGWPAVATESRGHISDSMGALGWSTKKSSATGLRGE